MVEGHQFSDAVALSTDYWRRRGAAAIQTVDQASVAPPEAVLSPGEPKEKARAPSKRSLELLPEATLTPEEEKKKTQMLALAKELLGQVEEGKPPFRQALHLVPKVYQIETRRIIFNVLIFHRLLALVVREYRVRH